MKLLDYLISLYIFFSEKKKELFLNLNNHIIHLNFLLSQLFVYIYIFNYIKVLGCDVRDVTRDIVSSYIEG